MMTDKNYYQIQAYIPRMKAWYRVNGLDLFTSRNYAYTEKARLKQKNPTMKYRVTQISPDFCSNCFSDLSQLSWLDLCIRCEKILTEDKIIAYYEYELTKRKDKKPQKSPYLEKIFNLKIRGF